MKSDLVTIKVQSMRNRIFGSLLIYWRSVVSGRGLDKDDFYLYCSGALFGTQIWNFSYIFIVAKKIKLAISLLSRLT